MSTQTETPDGEAVLKELAKAARRTGWWVQMGQESAFALVAHVDHLQATLKAAIEAQGEYVSNLRKIALENEGLQFAVKAKDHEIIIADETIERLKGERTELKDILEGLLSEIDALIGDSHGVYGLHLNGDDAPWDEIEDWLPSRDTARTALKEQS